MGAVPQMTPWTRIALAALAIVLSASTARAHPIHTTLTVVTASASGVTLNIRTFADDFSATVARFAGKRAPADSSASADDVLRYVRARFAVRDARGSAVTLEPCGVRRTNELYWLCFKAIVPVGVRGLTVRNQMLTELHADQVNIVQVELNGAKRTMLFTRTSKPSAIGAA